MPPRDLLTPSAPPTLDPVEDITRRRLLTALPAIGLIAAGVSCGGDDDDDADDETAATATPGRPDGAFPRTLRQHNGELTIEARPERVVALSSWDLDFVVSAGIAPVAAVLPLPLFAWLQGREAVAGMTVHQRPPGGELSFEAVAAARPDLLVDTNALFTGYPGQPDVSATLRQIAPTLSAPVDPVSDGWRERLRHVGRATGREDTVEAAIAEAEAAVALVREQHPEFEGKSATFGIAPAPGQVLLIVGEQDFTRQFLAELGFVTPPAQMEALARQSDAGGTNLAVSFEQMRLLDADVVIIGNDTIVHLQDEPAFQSLDAFARGAVVPLDVHASFAIRAPSPANIPFFIERAVPRLADALRG